MGKQMSNARGARSPGTDWWWDIFRKVEEDGPGIRVEKPSVKTG